MVISETIIAIIIGWLLSQLAAYGKGRREDNKTRKEVLFYMLEIYDAIPKVCFDVKAKMINSLEKEFGKRKIEISNEDKRLLSIAISKEILPLLEILVNARFKIVTTKYEESINKLSSIDPISAFSLSGRTDLIKHNQAITGQISSAIEGSSNSTQGGGTEEAKKIKDYISEKMSDKINEVQTFIFKKIKRIAFRINVFYWLKILWTYRLWVTQEEEDEEFDELIAQVVKDAFSRLDLSNSGQP